MLPLIRKMMRQRKTKITSQTVPSSAEGNRTLIITLYEHYDKLNDKVVRYEDGMQSGLGER